MPNVDGKPAGGSLSKKLLMPVVATTVSVLATYAGRKAPELIEKKLMPKLRDAGSGTEDLVSGLTGRARSAVEGLGNGGGDAGSSSSRRRVSRKDLDERRRERAEHRSKRSSASRGSASERGS